MVNFIYEGHISHDLCDRIIEYHKSSDKKFEGLISRNHTGEVDKNIKESIDVTLDYNESLYDEYVIKDFFVKNNIFVNILHKNTTYDTLFDFVKDEKVPFQDILNYVKTKNGISDDDSSIRPFRSDICIAVISEFVCPTAATRESFGKPDILIWMNRIETGRFEDTNKMWEKPEHYDLRIDNFMTVEEEVQLVLKTFGLHDWKAPTTLMLGRYQPWHEGHHALYKEAGKRTEQVVLGVRDTQGTSEKDPLSFEQVKSYIDKDPYMKGAIVVKFPNITNIVYGRDVGYKIEQVELAPEIQAISATQKRKELGI